jgi:hypothetical protein
LIADSFNHCAHFRACEKSFAVAMRKALNCRTFGQSQQPMCWTVWAARGAFSVIAYPLICRVEVRKSL